MKASSLPDRRFRLIAFDWDGTAVTDRAADATPVRGSIERLLRCDVLVVVITGTNLHNIDVQLTRAIRGRHKRNLFLATNRGSEVYGFDAGSEPILLAKRTATPDEEGLLTAVADAVRDNLIARLEVNVIYDRLNRRKVDLIPIEPWKDPPKSAIGALLVAVETRLKAAGLAGGVQDVIEIAATAARAKGLADVRITSDVKHVEIGLTDKADSVIWMMRELARPRGIPAGEILIVGDEFGPIAGVPGSDSRMVVAETAGAVFVSVGPEPGGAPPGVLHLPGGPARFRELVASQASLYPVSLPATAEVDPEWTLVEDGFVVAREHEIESLFAIGNGLVGSRGSLAEGSALSAPATFLAGVFETSSGSAPELARAPEWCRLSATVNGSRLRIDDGEPLEHRRILDLRQGILWRQWRHRDAAGRITRVEGLRLASLADRHLLLQSVTLTPENYTGAVAVEMPALATLRTARGVSAELAEAVRFDAPDRSWSAALAAAPGPQKLEVELGKTYRLDRIVSVHTSREEAPRGDAIRSLQQVFEGGTELALEAHRAAWRARWDACDISIEGDPDVQRAIRFALYHLISAANPDDEHVSIGARALTGPAYKGHVFWDTEIFMLPCFTLTQPASARALLMYRYHTLPAARARAARLGYRGALYAWESADTGDDVTPSHVVTPTGELIRILVGDKELHISADIAYAVWQYWEATADEPFLRGPGAEILVETARFWASRVRREPDGHYHIRDVIGPDEYHVSVDDDAYTNGMARWNLEVAAAAASLIAERWPDAWRQLSERLRVDAVEAADWRRIATELYTGFDPRTGLFEQFQGYFGLDEIELDPQRPETIPIDMVLGRERVERSKIIKQPDVVMLLYLLGHRFPREVREANYRYYDRRTAHGSSLSPAIHAAMAAQLGDTELAMSYLHQAIDIDLANHMGNAAGGVHAAALGGLWQALVFGFAGLAISPDGPRLQPHLPAGWRGIRFAIQWRGARVPVEVRREPEAAVLTTEAHA